MTEVSVWQAKKAARIARKARRKAHRPKKRLKTLPSLKKTAWKLLSELVRRNAALQHDYGTSAACYTCGEVSHWKELQAGHAIPGRTGAVLLDEEIIRPQDEKCNIWGRGMHHVFATKLIREKGLDWWEAKLLSAKQIKKWSRSDLEEKIFDYKARLSQLEGL